MTKEFDVTKVIHLFECNRCDACCRVPGFVALEEGEPEEIASFLGMETYEFTKRHCELLDRLKLALKKNPDQTCIFLTTEGCQIHPVKPRQCEEFPILWRTPKSFQYCEGLKALAEKKDSE